MKFDANKLIRKLAKCNYYQTIYSQEKNVGLSIFKNNVELTYIQIIFLNYLAFYSALYFDFSMGDIGEEVFEDFIYEDAYMYFRKNDKSNFKDNQQKKVPEQNKPVTSQWVFKSPKKVK